MIKKIVKKFKNIVDLPKTIYVNFRTFPFNVAIRLPISISHLYKIRGIKKGSFVIVGKPEYGMIRIGKGSGTPVASSSTRGMIRLADGAKIIFGGEADIAMGCSIIGGKNARIDYGNRFSCNTGCTFLIYKSLQFGEDVVLGWNVSVRDGDGHFLVDKLSGNVINHAKGISVKDHVWICSDTVIMKGAEIPEGSVIACNTLISKPLKNGCSIYGGYPVRELKQNIEWVRDGRNYV